jgi:hypothetical protein
MEEFTGTLRAPQTIIDALDLGPIAGALASR